MSSRGCLSAAEEGLGRYATMVGSSRLCSALLLGLDNPDDIAEEKAHEHPMLGGLPGQTCPLFEESSSLGPAIQIFFSLEKNTFKT